MKQSYSNTHTIKTTSFPKDLERTIQELADSNERSFSSQVVYMLKKQVEIIESTKFGIKYILEKETND